MNKGILSALDWSLLFPTIILVIFGLATIFSVSTTFFTSQLIYVFVSLFAFFLFSQVHYKVIQLYGIHIYIAAVIILLFVLFLGFESRGAVRWVDVFGFRIQFSEILKPFLIISLASFLKNGKNYSFSHFVFCLLFLLPVTSLIFFQPDLGSALIYAGATIATMLVFGFPFRWFVVGLFGMILFLPVFWQFLHDYQKQRVLTFLSPGSDPLGTSYNAIQAMIAVGSGSIFGKGLGEGTQSVLRFLPERHTDFVFATLSESFGFVGGVVIIGCFAYLLYRIYVLYQRVDDKFRKAFCVAAFFLFLIQFFVNIGMNIGLVPIVGITLPFVSYGGSSLLSCFILLGILSSFSFQLKEREVLEIR